MFSHHLSSSSCCAAHSSSHRTGWLLSRLSRRRSHLILSSCRAASCCLIVPAGCCIIISRCPIICTALLFSHRTGWLLHPSPCAALWLSHCLSSSSHCAALSLSCQVSWLSHYLLLFSCCATLLSTHRVVSLPLLVLSLRPALPTCPLFAPDGC